jgi:acetylornithine deacetylase/succinyl-diaminopimelate desuccinylase-like protein
VVFSDTLLWRADHPAVCMSLRGTLLAHLEVFGPLRDVHSGAVSGPAPNPLHELSQLIGSLHDDKGRVTVPGFYDDVADAPQWFRAELAALPYTDEDWLRRSDTRRIGGETGYTVLERLWTRPAIEAISVIAGDPIGPSRAAVPAVASADLSIRTVPGQQIAIVAEQIRRWVAQGLSDLVEYELSISVETGRTRIGHRRTPRGRRACGRHGSRPRRARVLLHVRQFLSVKSAMIAVAGPGRNCSSPAMPTSLSSPR